MCFKIKQSAEIVTNLNVTRNTCPLNQISEGQKDDVKIPLDHAGIMYSVITRSVPHEIVETPLPRFPSCYGN